MTALFGVKERVLGFRHDRGGDDSHNGSHEHDRQSGGFLDSHYDSFHFVLVSYSCFLLVWFFSRFNFLWSRRDADARVESNQTGHRPIRLLVARFFP